MSIRGLDSLADWQPSTPLFTQNGFFKNCYSKDVIIACPVGYGWLMQAKFFVVRPTSLKLGRISSQAIMFNACGVKLLGSCPRTRFLLSTICSDQAPVLVNRATSKLTRRVTFFRFQLIATLLLEQVTLDCSAVHNVSM